MKHIEFLWKTKDGIEMFGQSWSPDVPARASIVLVHGLGEHSGRYSHVAEFFVAHGFSFVASDHRGHGKSTGKRGHAASYEDFCQEIDYLIDLSKQNNPGKPLFLYGHSLGGAVVLYYALKHHPTISGVIATSPGLEPAKNPPAVYFAGKIMAAVAPGFILKNGLDLTGISHDPQVIENYKKDPLNHPDISARLGVDLISNGIWIREHANEFPLPLLLLQGSADRVISVAATREFAQKLPSQAIYREWEGGYHELHNEPDKEKVFAVMLEWIETILIESHLDTPQVESQLT